MPGLTRRVLFTITFALLLPILSADEFEDRKLDRLESCRTIPASESRTGLIFNSEGMKTMYVRSECLQQLAIDERDLTICDDVKEKKSWFFDGSGISPGACKRNVVQAKKNDQATFRTIDPARFHRVESIRIQRNGNGRDFDVAVETVGAVSHRSTLEISLTRKGQTEAHVIYENTHGFADSPSSLLLPIDRQRLDEILQPEWQSQTWNLRAVLTYKKDGSNRFWYDRVDEKDRRSLVESTLRFDDLPLWTPEPLIP